MFWAQINFAQGKAQSLTTVAPRQFFGYSSERCSKVNDGIRHDDIVVDGNEQRDNDHAKANTLGNGCTLPQLQRADPCELTHGCLHVVHRFSDENKENDVGE